jgi:hypothetical protein
MCWWLLILAVCVCVCVFVASPFFEWQEDVDFGDECSTVLAFFAPGNDVNEALSSWKGDVWL